MQNDSRVEMRYIVALLVLWTTLVHAQPTMEYELSLVGMNMDYKEHDENGVLLDSEKSQNMSDMMGAEMAYRYFLDSSTLIQLQYLGVEGTTEYIGAYLDSHQPYGSVVGISNNEIRDIALYYDKKKMNLSYVLMSGIGVGYRYWYRELSATQAEFYRWYSLRAHIGFEYNINPVTIALLAEYQYGLFPTMTASDVSGKFKLGAADVMKFSLPVTYSLNSSFSLKFSYVYEIQKIKRSNTVYGSDGVPLVEPDSRANNQYLKIGFVFKY